MFVSRTLTITIEIYYAYVPCKYVSPRTPELSLIANIHLNFLSKIALLVQSKLQNRAIRNPKILILEEKMLSFEYFYRHFFILLTLITFHGERFEKCNKAEYKQAREAF